jgi:hypothetical protein
MWSTTYNRFKTSGFNLFCKICEKPIKVFDLVESKASGTNLTEDGRKIEGPKLYHAECYDEAHELFEYDEEKLQIILDEEGRETIEKIFWEFDVDPPEGLSNEELIDLILNLEEKWVRDNHNI